jgi:hypothetical protein
MFENTRFSPGAAVASGPSGMYQKRSREPRSRTFRTRLIVLISLVLLTAGVITTLFLTAPEPPTWLLQSAKQSVETAQKAGALRYSEKTYRHAEALVTQGWMEMARQNGRLAPLRDYDNADSLLLLAIKTASDATTQTRTYVTNIQALALQERSDLGDELTSWEEALNGSLAKLSLSGYYSSASLALETADRLMSAGEYEEARESMSVAHTWMKRLGESLNRYDNDQAGALNIWRRWVQETLDDSRATGSYAVVVDKAAHKSYLVRSGKLIRTYNCDLGYNSARQKMFAGDGATPEGKYVVSVAKPHGSRYYKALLINYPNEADRKRFSDNKSKGVISQRARIGSLIEIHGNGGRDRDWTEGCVALTDKDMDNIMQFVGVGTPITIVRRSDQWP